MKTVINVLDMDSHPIKDAKVYFQHPIDTFQFPLPSMNVKRIIFTTDENGVVDIDMVGLWQFVAIGEVMIDGAPRQLRTYPTFTIGGSTLTVYLTENP